MASKRKARFKVGQVVFYSMKRFDDSRLEGYGAITRMFGKGPHAANVAGCRFGMDELRPLTAREKGGKET